MILKCIFLFYSSKQALSYDYEENPQPKQYLFRGSKLEYDKNENLNFKKQPPIKSGTNNHFVTKANLNNMNSEYFETKPNMNQF